MFDGRKVKKLKGKVMGKQERMPHKPQAVAVKGSKGGAGKKAGEKVGAQAGVAAESAPRAQGRNKRSDETIKQILVAAEQVILESGVERVAIQDVCEVAGLSRGTFYRYFSSQEELLDAFSAHKRERFHLALHAATAPYLVPDERFKALIAYLDNYLKHSKARRLLEVAPDFAFSFFKRIFHDSIERFQEVLGIVFDAWDARLGVKLDRELVCEMLIRYVLSELLVPRKGDRRVLLESVASMTAVIAGQSAIGATLGNAMALSAPASAQGSMAPLPAVAATREAGRNRRSEETINQILKATETVVLESGVERMSIQTVCEVAGISRGTFYRYFSAQDDLLDAYTQHKRAQFHQGLLAAVLQHDDPDQRFNALVGFLDHFIRTSKARRLLEVAPVYAFGFYQRGFDDTVARLTDLLGIVYDAWDTRLGVRLDRMLVSEMLLRYVLSELLVQGDENRRQVPLRIAALVRGIAQTHVHSQAGREDAAALAAANEMASVAASAPDEPGRNRRSDQTIAQILAAAETVILESGVERVSILEVCEVAGVSRGTFYRYFKSQDELLDAFTQNQRMRFHQALTDVAARHTDPVLRFHAVIDHMDAFLRRDKVRRLLKVAPEYAFGFFQRTFDDAIARYKTVLDIVFDAWEQRLGTGIDRDFACELLVRYMLSELLVPTDARKPLLPRQLETMFGAILLAQGR
ncbi:MAG: TetR/AcrR family transcriptional regulator [Burkholderiaceae bacterium]|nr:TetR/AcrR family transcriptional regulator [Burkholderiaceae bacterium]